MLILLSDSTIQLHSLTGMHVFFQIHNPFYNTCFFFYVSIYTLYIYIIEWFFLIILFLILFFLYILFFKKINNIHRFLFCFWKYILHTFFFVVEHSQFCYFFLYILFFKINNIHLFLFLYTLFLKKLTIKVYVYSVCFFFKHN